MKRTRMKVLLSVFIIFSIILGGLPSNPSSIKAKVIENKEKESYSSYTEHPSITIYSDSEMIAAGFPGLGIEGDPYRIEYLNITTTDSNGIEIHNVTLYFTIQHCVINAWGGGIMIIRSPPGRVTIHNNTITGYNYVAISIFLAQNTTISENRCKYSGCGIAIDGSAESEDPYPLNEYGIPYIPEFRASITLVIVSIAFLIVLVNIKRKNKR